MPDPRTDAARNYIVRETLISVVINALISAGFVWVTFRGLAVIPVWTMGGLAVDFVPQTFMIALMGALVPTLLTRRRGRAGLPLQASAPPIRLPRNLALRVVALSSGATILLVPLAVLGLVVAAGDALGFGAALAVKTVYGAIVAAIVTPLALRQALHEGVAAS